MSKVILNKTEIARAMDRIAYEIVEHNQELEDLVIIGIRTRGVALAERLQKLLNKITNKIIPLGVLDITLYRDDLALSNKQPLVRKTKIPFDIENKVIILVDDVLFTGRTIRAAMDALMDLGRPQAIKLAILVDRGRRELPIHADYTGRVIPTSKEETVAVNLTECDKEDKVKIISSNTKK